MQSCSKVCRFNSPKSHHHSTPIHPGHHCHFPSPSLHCQSHSQPDTLPRLGEGLQWLPATMLACLRNVAAPIFHRTSKNFFCSFSPCSSDRQLKHLVVSFIIVKFSDDQNHHLYHIHQEKCSITAIKLHTLTSSSGWNERSLLKTYCQGLEPMLWLHLSAYDDSLGFKRFIQ